MPALIAPDGPLAGQRFEIGSELFVGREDQQLTVDDPEISRRHAVLRASVEGVTIEDLGSRNGTLVNGERINGTTALSHGDVVRFGTTSFEFDASGHQPVATVATPSPRALVPEQPFGAYAAAGTMSGRERRKVASRQLLPELVTFFAVFATAVALVLYFGLR